MDLNVNLLVQMVTGENYLETMEQCGQFFGYK